MPFASINPTNPRTNPWNFGGNCSAFGEVEKLSFFESAILNFFFQKKIFFFAFFEWKQVKVYWLARMGQNFDQAKCDGTFWPRPNILKGSVCLKYLTIYPVVETTNKKMLTTSLCSATIRVEIYVTNSFPGSKTTNYQTLSIGMNDINIICITLV